MENVDFPEIFRRQIGDPNDPNNSNAAYDAGEIARWVIAGVIVLFFVVWIGGGYAHARYRLKKGKAPLLYHRWLIPSTRYNPAVDPTRFGAGVPPGHYQQQAESIHMNNWNYPAPPPTYSADRPPQYFNPPPGAPPNKGNVQATVYPQTIDGQAASEPGTNHTSGAQPDPSLPYYPRQP